MWHPFIEMVR